MNLAAIFTAAHTTARTLTAGTYRARFAQGLRAAYAAAKAPKLLEIQVAYAGGNAVYGQYNTLLALGAQGLGLQLNASQFQKRVNYFVADEAIAALRAGQQVRFVK